MKQIAQSPQNQIQPDESLFVRHQLRLDLLKHIRGSHFLEVLTLAFFQGADVYLHRQCSLPRQHSALLLELLAKLDCDAALVDQRLIDNLRLIEKHKLLEDIFQAGHQSAACWHTKESAISPSLQQLVTQYSHYSLRDLAKHGYTDQHQNQLNDATPTVIPRQVPVVRWLKNPYLLATTLFLTLSIGGSWLLLWWLFPEILQIPG